MPTIPRLETKGIQAAPEFKATPNIAMGKAMEEGGKTLVNAGNQLMDYEQRATNAEKVLQYTEAKQNLAADIDNFRATFADRTDYDNFEADYNKGAQEILEKHRSAITYDDVARKVSPYLDSTVQRGLILTQAHGRRLRAATMEAKADTQIDSLLKDYAFLKRSGDSDAELKMSEAEMVISEMANTGAYSPAKAEKLRRDIPKMVDIWTLGQDADMAKTPEDIALISKALDDPKNYPNLGITERLQWKDKLRSHANILWGERQKAEHELREKTALDAFYLERDTKIPVSKKVAQIEQWMKPDPVTGLSAMPVTYGQSIIHRLEKPEGGTQGKTDPNTWADLFDRMHSDDPKERPTTQELLKARQQGKLSESDYEGMVKQTVVLKNQDKRAKSVEEQAFRKEQNDLYKEQQTLIKGLYSKDKKDLIPYMQKRIDQQIAMYKPGVDINKMRRDVEMYTQSLIDYAEFEGKGKAIKGFKEQFKKEFSPQDFEKEAPTPPKKEQSKPAKVQPKKQPEELPPGWKRVGDKVVNDKGKEMVWVE